MKVSRKLPKIFQKISVEQMEEGDSGYLLKNDILVNQDRDVYVDGKRQIIPEQKDEMVGPDAMIGLHSLATLPKIRVENGRYILTLPRILVNSFWITSFSRIQALDKGYEKIDRIEYE